MGGGEGLGGFSFIVRLFYECFVVNYAKRCLRVIDMAAGVCFVKTV